MQLCQNTVRLKNYKSGVAVVSSNKSRDNDQDDSGSQGEGGKTGKVGGPRVATFAGDARDEPKTPAERRHLAIVHEAAHADRVRRTLERQKVLAAAKEAEAGPRSLNQLLDQPRQYSGGGSGGGKDSPYNDHPLLSKAAQFSGMEDPPLPGQSNQDLNKEDRKELENRPENKLQHRLAPEKAPTYTPPTLKRY